MTMRIKEKEKMKPPRKDGGCPLPIGSWHGTGVSSIIHVLVLFVVHTNNIVRYAIAAAILEQMPFKDAMLHKATVTEVTP